jgi:ABC-type multidrug transport system ATPase subunit
MGVLPATEGTIRYETSSGQVIDPDDWYKHVVMAAPYLELIEEFTLQESVKFHTQFKQLKNGMTVEAFIERIELPQARHKVLRHFSSGMKQRVKLGLALFSEASLVVLDEPTSNLDHQGMAWYLREVTALEGSQILLIGSNQPQEYAFCKNIISVSTFK